MKKLLALVLALVLALSVMAVASADGLRVAMITDYGDITDQSFNQTTYEAAKAFCEANTIDFQYYKPASDSDEDRISSIEKAIDDGYTAIIMPGYAFGPAIQAVAPEYSDINFIALDVSEGDIGDLASAVPAVVRYGYGFVQGADAAAAELNKTDVQINYVYGNQFYGDSDITAYMDTWYSNGTEVVFACGGGIFTSAGEAASKAGQKVIGVDVDQAATIDGLYGEGITVTSAMKGLAATVNSQLTALKDGTFAGGKVENLGLVSEDSALNYVQIAPSTQFGEGFTQEDYAALVAKMFSGEVTVSNAIDAEPAVTAVTVDYQGNIK